MKSLVYAALSGGLFLSLTGAAQAEPWVDYTPVKGVWDKTYVHVESNRIDDYLVALKKTWVPEQEAAKKHGLIDDYQIMVRIDPAGGGANVLLCQHFTSLAGLDPDKARDQAIESENYAALPKAKGDEMVAGFQKYRTFVGDGFYQVMTFNK